MLELMGQRRAQALDTSVPFHDRLPVHHEGYILGAMCKGHRGQVVLMGRSPGTLAGVAATMAQQHGFELLWAAPQIDRCCTLQPAPRLLDRTMKHLRFSGRTRHRILKLARSIADLDGQEAIVDVHVGEAIMLHCLDRDGAVPR